METDLIVCQPQPVAPGSSEQENVHRGQDSCHRTRRTRRSHEKGRDDQERKPKSATKGRLKGPCGYNNGSLMARMSFNFYRNSTTAGSQKSNDIKILKLPEKKPYSSCWECYRPFLAAVLERLLSGEW